MVETPIRYQKPVHLSTRPFGVVEQNVNRVKIAGLYKLFSEFKNLNLSLPTSVCIVSRNSEHRRKLPAQDHCRIVEGRELVRYRS